MVFSSITFIFYFLPLFLAFYYLTGIRNAILLVGSAIFYTWGEGAFVALLLALVAINLWGGLLVADAKAKGRTWVLPIFITFNLLVLGVFKYTSFFLSTFGSLTGVSVPKIDLPLPLGISFFTFQLVSYLIDINRGTTKPERSYVRLATYIMMFPHLVAGPIVRYSHIVEELKRRYLTSERIGLGIQYFIVGLCQKVMIANTVAAASDHVFSLPSGELSLITAWIGASAYMLQIYFDFCGYSNMAIGLAFLLGFKFPRNFDYPYASRSITEFWRRWHMSLSFWFRDYVYIPLGGSRGGKMTTLRNLLIVFLLTGLWHGAAWTFIAWGLFHGCFLILERLGLDRVLARAPIGVARAYTLLVVLVGWVFFRATDFQHASAVLTAMAGFGAAAPSELIRLWLTPEVSSAMVIGTVFSFPVLPWLMDRMRQPRVLGPQMPNGNDQGSIPVHVLPIPVLVPGMIMSIALLAGNSLNPFLYFRF